MQTETDLYRFFAPAHPLIRSVNRIEAKLAGVTRLEVVFQGDERIVLSFVLMGLFGIWLDMATGLIASVAVGIAVDDTIHTYQGFRQRRQVGRGVAPSLARIYQKAGREITATTLILVTQFLIRMLSDFPPLPISVC